MLSDTYLTGATAAAFVAGVHFVDDSVVTIQGTARFDRRTGGITSLTGTFIQSGVFCPECFSSGKFTSKKISGGSRGYNEPAMKPSIWLHGGVPHDPGTRQSFQEALAKRRTSPHFVAVEWEKSVFEQFFSGGSCRPQ